MMRLRLSAVLAAVILLMAVVAAPKPASAATEHTCKEVVGAIVETAVKGVLANAIEKTPELKDLDQKALVKKAGGLFLTAERPDFKAYGYMMLLWYGDAADRELVSQTAGKLQTEIDRAHFYFVLGMYKVGSKDAKLAAEGRSDIAQMRARGDVTFVPDEMWDALIVTCKMSGS